ncbi:MAG: heavy metal translocating P-type ATPase metal-binding domain-containing protein, partial [Gammaproteobacteria bacterium]
MSCCISLADDPLACGTSACFHCGRDFQGEEPVLVAMGERTVNVCSVDCAEAVNSITERGLERFYSLRGEVMRSPVDVPKLSELEQATLANPAMQSELGWRTGDGLMTVALSLDGLRCAACVWLVEQTVAELPGVTKASVNLSTRRLTFEFDSEVTTVADVVTVLGSIGISALPVDSRASDEQRLLAERTELIRIGVAAAFGMQVMMISVALYFAAETGIAHDFEQLLRGAAAVLSLPIVGYAARPFWHGAKLDLAHKRVGMDVPISLGIALAFVASLLATWRGTGEIYFDSIGMFTLFLLSARFIERRVGRRATAWMDACKSTIPLTVRALSSPNTTLVVRSSGDELSDESVASDPEDYRVVHLLAKDVSPGVVIRVKEGELIALDGEVVRGSSSVNEAALTGEALPRPVERGTEVSGGTLNVEGVLDVRVVRKLDESLMARIERLVDSAGAVQSPSVTLANRVASAFLTGVVLAALVVAGVWWHLDPTRWVGITVAVLVATCPCALSLAIPAVNAAAVGALARVGMIPGSNASLEDLANVDHVMFDKTGTLTDGRFALTEAWYAPNFDAAKIQRIAYALEHDSAHPIGVAIAQAFSQAAKDTKASPVRDWENVPGEGVSGWVDGERYWLGTPQFLNRTIGLDALPLIEKGHFSKRSSLSVLADDSQLLAVFACEDSIRVEARGMVEDLLAAGDDRPITLYWGVRTEADLYAKALIDEIAERHHDFRFVPV